MKLRVHQDTLINGRWTGVGVGDFDPAIAEHLIRIGVAEKYEIKIIEDVEVKKPTPSSASQAAPASPEKTVKRRRGRPRKQSPSTTAGE